MILPDLLFKSLFFSSLLVHENKANAEDLLPESEFWGSLSFITVVPFIRERSCTRPALPCSLSRVNSITLWIWEPSMRPCRSGWQTILMTRTSLRRPLTLRLRWNYLRVWIERRPGIGIWPLYRKPYRWSSGDKFKPQFDLKTGWEETIREMPRWNRYQLHFTLAKTCGLAGQAGTKR